MEETGAVHPPIADRIAGALPSKVREEFLAGLATIAERGTTMMGPRSVDLGQYLHDWYWAATVLYGSVTERARHRRRGDDAAEDLGGGAR